MLHKFTLKIATIPLLLIPIIFLLLMSIIYKVVIKRKVTRALENAYAQGQSDCMEGKIKIKLADENSLKNEYYSFLGIKLTIFRKQQFYFIEYPLDDEKESAMNPNNY